MLLFSSIDFYLFQKTNRVSNSLDPDVSPDLGPLLLADVTIAASKERVKNDSLFRFQKTELPELYGQT